MSDEFDRDRKQALHDLDEARAKLLETIRKLTDDDLAMGRRGSWTVREAIEHVVGSDRGTAAGIAERTGAERLTFDWPSISSIANAIQSLEQGLQAMHAACEGMSEEGFYEMKPFHGQDSSILGILGTSTTHDGEHGEQIRTLLG